ncbi:uncharacterized protein L969DRAFT_64917 [Mixia osmundae IAM 14324]|uniref:Nuclear cap-binding protein subunit 2 n=1 Tax=Mixia osmundae (strain CBS 9802 / IAM 14324 / JCM 22182 / KY 12970) TaxID=764103 RepID=G7DX04_MIXOS|nr:uncharacterized protein L969DRAFT_64917 [Mixia osmundae IAM 14324]KEI38090.1 hypothetical protein L969DRAFT_64917 [Mixia osmundae IAM 14324]GAA95101.1 hypothetical protein E5Q_01756 [Mixia osmundae IAM 14324]
MATLHVCPQLDSTSGYKDRQSILSYEDQQAKLASSTTLYVGNMSFFTTEEQIYELFSRTGSIKRIIMGLDRMNKTPCGFCFVEYYTNQDARAAMRYISGTKLDDRVIRADLDPGFIAGRQYGRGRAGGQVRDEYREDFDAGRGGWGHLKAQQQREAEEAERERQQGALYRNDHDMQGMRDVPMGEQTAEENMRFRREIDEEEEA